MGDKQLVKIPGVVAVDAEYLSQKLRIFSFILMGMVVYIHAYNINVTFEGTQYAVAKASSGRIFSWAAFIQEFISDGLCRVAVPYFFMISSYLLFAKYSPSYTFRNFAEALKRRFKTLVIPFFIVSVGGLLLVVFLQKLPGTDVFFRAYKLENLNTKLVLYKLFLLPVSYQLWFINYLFFCVLISPVIYWFIRFAGAYYIFGLLILWIDYNLQYKLHVPQIRIETLLAFSLGAFLAIRKVPIPKVESKWFAIVFLALWIGITWFRTEYKFQTWSFAEVHYWLKLAIFMGILATWSAYDVWFSNLGKSKVWLSVASFNFGIYLFHEPMLTIIKKLAIRFSGNSEFALLVVYFLSGLAAILFSYYLSKIWKKVFPKGYALITGGR